MVVVTQHSQDSHLAHQLFLPAVSVCSLMTKRVKYKSHKNNNKNCNNIIETIFK